MVLTTAAQTGPGGVGTSTNNVLWLRGDAGVSVSGSSVTGWSDRSGNGHLASPPTASARPTLMATGLNGYPTLSFDGTDDELRVPDASSLDLQQWDFFLVGNVAAAKNNNAWLCKGTSTQPNYGMWSTSTNAVQLPIYDILGNLSSPTTPANATGSAFNVLHYDNTVYFGFAPARTVYKNGTSIYSDLNLLNLPVTNNNALYIGNVQGTTGWNLNGQLAEVIAFKSPINQAQRVIINNYLAAKYGLALSSGDIYTQDDPAKGNYDHDVAGIGRVNSSNIQSDSRGSGLVQINNATNLTDNKYLFWGHNGGALGAWGSSDFPSPLQGRWPRSWRVNEVNASGSAVDVGGVDIIFDLTGQGPVTATDLRLLVDANNNGLFADDAPLSGAVSIGSNKYKFAGVTALSNNLRFTLGTINLNNTPLPIALLSFTAKPDGGAVRLDWATATERENDHFTVERSADLEHWTEVVRVPGAGNSVERLDYAAVDASPLTGTSYYRLKQTDLDGAATWSSTEVVFLATPDALSLFPNPATTAFTVLYNGPTVPFDVFDAQGRSAHPVLVRYGPGRAEVNVSGLAPGVYTLRFAGDVKARRVVIGAGIGR